MVFKHFRFQVIVRVIFIVLTLLVIVFIYQKTAYAVSSIIFILLLIFQVLALIRYTEQTNRKLTRFFESIRHADFTSSFSDKELGKSFEDLNREFNEVIEAFNKNKTEKEEHFNYLLTVIQHVSIGIIVYKKNGAVDVYNNAVKRLLQVKHLRDIKHLSEISEELPERLFNLKAGEKSLIKVFVGDELLQLSIYATRIQDAGRRIYACFFPGYSS